MKNNETDTLQKLLEFTESLLKGDYSKRIISDIQDNIVNTIATNLNKYADEHILNSKYKSGDSKNNIDHFIDTISSFANHDFDQKLPITDNNTVLDAIAMGINILGDELEQSTISRDYFSNIYNAVSEILIVTDLKGKIIDINNSTKKSLNIDKDDFINIPVKKILSSKFKKHEKIISDFFNSKKTVLKFETAFKNYNGPDIPVDCAISKIFDHSKNHEGYLIIAKDITEQKNKELHELKIVMNAQERERKRLAYDLHDSLGQEVNAIKMYLNLLLHSEPYSKKYLNDFETCKKLVDNSIETIRNISFDLLPKTLENSGFTVAVKELIKRLSTVCNIEYDIDNIKLTLEKEIQVIIYRVIQEFINNSLKHAQCTTIFISITLKNNEIKIELKDNGKGFDLNKVELGNGIYNIKSRLEAINAKYEFDSKLNLGTRLLIKLKQSQAKKTVKAKQTLSKT